MKYTMELVTIGSELLNGRTLNTHAQALGGALSGMGWQLARDTTVPDDPSAIQGSVAEALSRVDVVIVSGGLGPTSDDITREVLGDMFGCKVIKDQTALKVLCEKIEARGLEVVEAAERMAQVLEGSDVLINPVGAAAAMRLGLPEEQSLFIVPGPPSEFAGVLEAHVLPWLRNTFGAQEPTLETVTVLRGIGEAKISMLFEAEGLPPAEISAGFYPGNGRVEIILTTDQAYGDVLEETTLRVRALLAEFVSSE